MVFFHSYGILVTYDEVLRLRVTVAKYFGERQYISRELRMNGAQIGSCTPTHQMVKEKLMLWPLSLLNCHWMKMRMIHSIIIARVSKTEMKKTKLSKLAPVEFHYYNGPKKPISPYTEDHQGIPFQDVVNVNKDIKAALLLDVGWLGSVVKNTEDDGELPVDWLGYMNQNVRENDSTRKETKYVFGPLVDATQSHPDSVLTSIIFTKDFMTSYS